MTLNRFLFEALCPSLEWDKAASYPACQCLTAHDALYASLKRNERAQSSSGLLGKPKGQHGRAPLPSREGFK
jgi:hypothetical protein